MSNLDEKRKLALTYIKERGKYIAASGCTFTPTDSSHTDIRVTMERYRREVLKDFPAVFRKRARA